MAVVDIEPWGLFENLWSQLDEHAAEAPEPAAKEQPKEREAPAERKRPGRKPRAAAALPVTLKARGKRPSARGQGNDTARQGRK